MLQESEPGLWHGECEAGPCERVLTLHIGCRGNSLGRRGLITATESSEQKQRCPPSIANPREHSYHSYEELCAKTLATLRQEDEGEPKSHTKQAL